MMMFFVVYFVQKVLFFRNFSLQPPIFVYIRAAIDPFTCDELKKIEKMPENQKDQEVEALVPCISTNSIRSRVIHDKKQDVIFKLQRLESIKEFLKQRKLKPLLNNYNFTIQRKVNCLINNLTLKLFQNLADKRLLSFEPGFTHTIKHDIMFFLESLIEKYESEQNVHVFDDRVVPTGHISF